jgi:o-succinylbenzoate synthase
MPEIRSFELLTTRLHCKKPFRIATGVSDVCQGILLRLTTASGLTGLGEAVPIPHLTGETLEGAREALREELMPRLLGLDCWGLQEAHARMDAAVTGHPSARAAVDLALHDLAARACGQPLVRFLGGRSLRVETNYSIGLASPPEAAAEARSIVESGYHIVKLKVGDDPDTDVARVKAVRSAMGPDLKLRIDANEGWTPVQALRALSRMEPFRVELVEQPVARWNWRAMAELRARVGIPIAADEGVHTSRDAARAIEAGAIDIINIKLMKSGGLAPARDIVALARAHGIGLMVGGMVGESALAVTAAASLAAAFGFEYADLDADLLLRDQLCRQPGIGLEGSDRVLSELPGLGGLELDAAFLS